MTMIHENPVIVARFPDRALRELFYDGHCEGWRIGKMAHADDVTAYMREDGYSDEAEPTALDWANYVSGCEVHSRQFSPGECLCAEINAYPDPEDAWQAWEAGVRHGGEAAYWFYEVIGEGSGPKMAGGMMFFQQGGAA
jgi:hypothetical protein